MELARVQLHNRIHQLTQNNGRPGTHPPPQLQHSTTPDRQLMDTAPATQAQHTTKHLLPGESSPIIIESRTPSPTSPAYDRTSPTNTTNAAAPNPTPYSLGGYPAEPHNPPAKPSTPAVQPQPTLRSILKDMRTNPPPHLQPRNLTLDQPSRYFRPIPHSTHPPSTSSNRPIYPKNVNGNPWCDCCTAQLSDDDDTQTGLLDPVYSGPAINSAQTTKPPSHSNRHLGYIAIFRANADYHTVQRAAIEIYQARTGILPTSQPTYSIIYRPRRIYLPLTIRALPRPWRPSTTRPPSLRPRIQQPKQDQYDPRGTLPQMVSRPYLAQPLFPRRGQRPLHRLARPPTIRPCTTLTLQSIQPHTHPIASTRPASHSHTTQPNRSTHSRQ